MIDIKPKDAIQLDIFELDKSDTYPKEDVLLEDGLHRYLHHVGEQYGDQKR